MQPHERSLSGTYISEQGSCNHVTNTDTSHDSLGPLVCLLFTYMSCMHGQAPHLPALPLDALCSCHSSVTTSRSRYNP